MPSATDNRIDRVRQMMDERGYDALVLRNNPDLRWLTGAEHVFDYEVAHTAVITRETTWLHTDSRYLNSFRERLGDEEPWLLDQELVTPAVWTARRLREIRARVVAVEDTCDLAFYDALGTACASLSIAPTFPRLHGDLCDLRMVKDEQELELLRAAQRVTDAAFDHMCDWIRAGQTEQEIRVELENYMLTHGADGLSFDTIIASGPNGANPHARPSQRVVERGDLIVMDYGALVGDYHADMTRTVCVGEPSAEQREVYDIVRRAHEECAAMIAPGVIGRDVHMHSVEVIREAGYGEYYGHGLGHGVGIEIHERPNLGRTYDKPLPEGSVVTVEPGIYLPGRFGIRLEDCGVVTSDGYRPFTQSSHDLHVVDA